MMHYGFALEDNKFDSFEVLVNMDIARVTEPLLGRSEQETMAEGGQTILIDYSERKGHKVETVKLRKGCLCPKLMTYLRLLLQQQEGRIDRTTDPTSPVCPFHLQKPSDTEFEIHTLESYSGLVSQLLEARLKLQDLDEDIKRLLRLRLEKNKDFPLIFALVFRIDQLRILLS